MNIEAYPCGPYATNVYVIKSCATKEAIVIDAAPESYSKLESILKDYKVHLFLTHGHWDHTTDAALFQKAGACVYAHKDDEPMYIDPEKMRLLTPSYISLNPVTPNTWVTNGQEISLAGMALKIIHIPGHTLGQIGIYIKEHNALFVGDTLFLEGVGRTDLPGGNSSRLTHSIRQKIYTLPDNTCVYPGHGPSTTIGHERAYNPFVNGI